MFLGVYQQPPPEMAAAMLFCSWAWLERGKVYVQAISVRGTEKCPQEWQISETSFEQCHGSNAQLTDTTAASSEAQMDP